jgi:FkbM family methyltransferase
MIATQPVFLEMRGMGQKTGLNRVLRAVKDHTYPNRVAKRFEHIFASSADDFLRHATRVIHVGANTGQERDIYAQYGLDVLWIEPIPEVFRRLAENIASYPKQRAINALVTDKEDEEYTFNLSSNDGLSSSIFDFKGHKEIWPDIEMVSQIKLKSRTLDTLIEEAGGSYDTLIMDTQGSELLVLKGARKILTQIRFVKTEAADFEVYDGCTTVAELTRYLRRFGFRLIERSDFAITQNGNSCCDLTFKRALF